jgi:hypothetical protein
VELIIYNPTEDGFLKEISFNNEEIKKELATRLEKYQGITYSEDSIKTAKADRATLNKFKEAIERKRIEIKKQCLAPYEAFEYKIKEITLMVDVPIGEIDRQVKAFEESQKDEKKGIIEGVYEELIGDLREILPLSRMWNEKWLNATCRLSAITEEISNKIERVKNDLQVIETLESEFVIQTKDKYLTTLDLSAALAEKARLEEQAKKIKEYDAEQHRKKMEEADRRIQEEKEKALKKSETPAVVGEVVAQVVGIAPLDKDAELANNIPQTFTEVADKYEQLEELDFRVWVSPEQKQLLKEFLKNNNIKYGRCD